MNRVRALQLQRLYADVSPLLGDDLVYALTDDAGCRLLREDGNFDDIEKMFTFQAACDQIGAETEVIAVTSAYLNSPRQTYWLMLSALYLGQQVQDMIFVLSNEIK